jgi:hypothetical protein
MRSTQVSLGQLVNMLFETYANRYHDNELAALAAGTTINDMLTSGSRVKEPRKN